MEKYIIAIDQGTTSTRALLVDKNGRIVARASRNVDCLYPKPGWVEADPNQLFVSLVDVVNEVLIVSSKSLSDIDSLAITNQRETAVVFERDSGRAIYNAIVWQSKQTAGLCEERRAYEPLIHAKTGLLVNPYFSASKIRFILDRVPGAQKRAEEGELLAGTVDAWLIYKLSKGKRFLTDYTNASRSLLFDISKMEYDEELCRIWNIPMKMLPVPLPSSGDFGTADFFSEDLHIRGVAGDQQAALFGQGCHEKGEGKNTYGTGCFMLLNTGTEPFYSRHGLLTTLACSLDGRPRYALEGSVLVGGAVVQWLRDELRLFKESGDSEEYASRRPDTAGVYFVPAFVGLGTPYWDDEARGAVFGLTRGSDRHNIARAALYSIAYQSKDVIETMKEETGLGLKSLKVDGGASANGMLMQFQSDILGTDVILPRYRETTALGAAYLAGLSSGFFKDLAAIRGLNPVERRYVPKMTQEERDNLYRGWKKAVEATLAFKI